MYTAAWSIDSSTIGSSSRCSSRESSRYSTDSYPIFVSSGSDNGTGTTTGAGTGTGTGTGTGKIRDRRPSDGPGDGSLVDDRTLGSASIDAATKTKHASLDPLEVFLADHDHNHDHDDEDRDEDDKDEDEDDEKRHGLEIRHTVTDWTQNRYGPNHYFREKKWDFFPELATPGALPGGKFPSGRPASTTPQTKTKTGKSSRTRNLSTFDFGRLNGGRGRGNTLDLAQNVRDSIKSVQRKLSNKPSSLEKEKARQRQQPRPSTARSERYGYGALSQRTATTPSSQRTRTTTDSGSRNGNGSISKPPNYEDIFTASDRLKRTLSAMSTRSSIMASPQSLPLPRRPKPLAVPLSPYQKYGAAIWEKSSVPRHRIASHNVRFPRYYQNRRCWSSSLFSTSSSSSSYCFSSTSSSSTTTTSSNSGHVNRLRRTQSNPVLPVSIPLRLQLQRSTREYVRALQDGTSSMLGAIDGAKRRVIDARVDRRRAQLKARIRLVGPVDPYTASYGRGEAWV